MSDILTIGDLKRLTGQPTAVLNYAIDRYGPAPCGKVGNARIWTVDALAMVRESLARTARNSTSMERRTSEGDEV